MKSKHYKRIPLTKKDMAWVSWSPKDIEEKAHAIVREHKKYDDKIKQIPKEKRTFQNTIIGDYPKWIWSDHESINMLTEISPNKDVREMANTMTKYLAQEFVKIGEDPEMYRALKEYNPRREQLRPEDKKLHRDLMRAWKRKGFDLPQTKRKQLLKKKQQLAALSIRFRKNLNDYHDEILVTKEELLGLPDHYIGKLQKKSGKYVVSLDYPESGPFMDFAESHAKRKELGDKLAQKGGRENLRILKSIIRLRSEIASILGYKNYAEFRIEDRMAKNPQTVFRFYDRIIPKLKRGVSEDETRLLREKKALGMPGREVLYYERAYLFEKAQARDLGFQSDALREYFPFSHVRKRVLSFYEKLFSIRFKPVKLPLWHSDVESYGVYDDKNRLLGYALFDLYPREGKFKHMAVFNFRDADEREFQKPERGVYAPVAIMVGNFPKETKQFPSLLSHEEVTTFFHEFGHMMHVILTEAIHVSQSGVNVAWDFVELPSQMFENWVWEPQVLGRLSKHQVTHSPIPHELVKKLIQSRKYLQSQMFMRQIVLGKLDMLLHTTKRDNDPVTLYRNLTWKLLRARPSPKSLFPAGFGHMLGYDAGYYSYLWALVYAYDCFSLFKKKGITNTRVADTFRREILAMGSSRPEMESLKKFLGRNPSEKAFLENILK